jgi:hypothetical protein
MKVTQAMARTLFLLILIQDTRLHFKSSPRRKASIDSINTLPIRQVVPVGTIRQSIVRQIGRIADASIYNVLNRSAYDNFARPAGARVVKLFIGVRFGISSDRVANCCYAVFSSWVGKWSAVDSLSAAPLIAAL